MRLSSGLHIHMCIFIDTCTHTSAHTIFQSERAQLEIYRGDEGLPGAGAGRTLSTRSRSGDMLDQHSSASRSCLLLCDFKAPGESHTHKRVCPGPPKFLTTES